MYSIEVIKAMNEKAVKEQKKEEHYIVINDWAYDDGYNFGIDIIGVAHSLEKAKEIFKNRIENEKIYAKENQWEVYEDTDVDFAAGDGSYLSNHTRLYIQRNIGREE